MSGWPKPDEQIEWDAVVTDADCTCRMTHPSTWETYGGATEPGSMWDPDPDCLVHRLTWDEPCERFFRALDESLEPVEAGGKAHRKATEQRVRAVAQIEKELRREAQRKGGGSWT